jgi:DNA-binding response OmpR family regulator
MLPGLSGRSVCKEIKQWSSDMPVIVVSAISDVADKVLLLESGADDYVTKPFSPRELLARVQAALRRNKKPTAVTPLSFGNVSVNFITMETHKADALVPLTAHEFKLLRFFPDNPGRAVSREELLSAVWGLNFHLTTRTVDNQILKLRQKLESDPANPVHFRTVHGIGYKFIPNIN